MTPERYQELAEAARALLPHLETSSDQRDDPWIDEVKRDLARSAAERLRQQADEIESMEAAIWRFRKAVAALDDKQGECPAIAGLGRTVSETIEGLVQEWSKANARSASEIERLQKLLDGRDKFIVDQGLWLAFVDQLPGKPD